MQKSCQAFLFLHTTKSDYNTQKIGKSKNRASFFANFSKSKYVKPLRHKASERFCVKTQKIF
jgi:hypothetical protein